MEIKIASVHGFCFGVKKSVECAETIPMDAQHSLYALGEIIHNKDVIKKLSKRGIITVAQKEEINFVNEPVVIIRAHGEKKSVVDYLNEKGAKVIDTTCPYVKAIHKIVEKHHALGYQIVIIGNPNHPEVIGINGWAGDESIIVSSLDDCNLLVKYDKICVVSQTTNKIEFFNQCIDTLQEHVKDMLVFNTICAATKDRQEACIALAQEVEAMVVIGGKNSSNTIKLAELARKHADNVYLIENAEDLSEEIKKFNKVGVTAGASTPDWIIEEVINKMNNFENDMMKMMDEYEKTMSSFRTGDVVDGTVIYVNDREAMVNIGYKSDGIIALDELTDDPNVKATDILSEGDTVRVLIVKMNDNEGNVVLSKKRVDNIKNWEELEEMAQKAIHVDAKVLQATKGGVIALVNNVRGFIPASMLSVSYVEDLQKFVGKTFRVVVKEVDSKKNRVILSRKDVEKIENEIKKNLIFDKLQAGEVREGEVVRLADFGAFVDIDGVDGLIHISELSWSKVKHPSDVLKVGDKVKVYVIDFDKTKNKISLSLKQTVENPWSNVESKYALDSIVEGTVKSLTDFGAFVELEQGVDGLVHISQIAEERINKPSDVLSINQKVMVKVISLELETKKIGLSIKEVNKKEEEVVETYVNEEEEVTVGDMINN